jgi:type I restriction enzyme S subunit
VIQDIQFKRVARLNYGDAIAHEDQGHGEVPVFGSNGVFSSCENPNTFGPAIIVGRKGSFGKVNWSPVPCWASDTTFFIDHRSVFVELRWLYYALQTLNLDGQSSEAAVPGINREEVYERRLPLVSSELQKRTAAYLDTATQELDNLIDEKHLLLELLGEKRRALITHAVTRGLVPDAPRRDSGIPWLGEIPAHWQVKRLKFLAEVRGGLTLGKDYGPQTLFEFPYLRVANVQDGFLNLSKVNTVMVSATEAESCTLRDGDVLMNEGGDIDKLGRGCVWHMEIANCLHQNHVFCVRPFAVKSEWLDAWTSTETAKSYFESRAKRATNLASISGTNIKELVVPLPPESEQSAILEHIQIETKKIKDFTQATERTITLLQERRSALISAAVSGQLKIDVSAREVVTA